MAGAASPHHLPRRARQVDLENTWRYIPSFSVILTNSANELACILRMACPRRTFTVISLIFNRDAICLFNRPCTTKRVTSCSPAVRDAHRAYNSDVRAALFRRSLSFSMPL